MKARRVAEKTEEQNTEFFPCNQGRRKILLNSPIMKKLLLLITLGASMSLQSNAQDMNASPDELAKMFKMPIRIEFADTNDVGRGEIQRYPQKNLGYLIKAAAEDLWKLNGKMEFETQSDMKRNLDRGEARNIYLFLTKHPESKRGSEIWILNYSRGDRYKEGKTDYQIYLPDLSKRAVQEFTFFDVQFTMSVMQEHMKHVQKNGKAITPMEYFYVEAAKYCKTLKAKKPNIVIDQAYLSKSVDSKAIRRSLRKYEHSLLTTGQINSVLEESKDTLAMILVYPGKFETLSNSALGEKYIFWNKILVYGSDYRVLGAVGNGRKDNVLIEIVQDDLESLLECD